MGISFFSSCCVGNSCGEVQNLKTGNPNPKRFEIEKIKSIGKFIIVRVKYFDCTNYEGNKIIVFENTNKKEVLSVKEIDPHFCDVGHISPVARFKPTKKGWNYAISFCRAVQ